MAGKDVVLCVCVPYIKISDFCYIIAPELFWIVKDYFFSLIKHAEPQIFQKEMRPIYTVMGGKMPAHPVSRPFLLLGPEQSSPGWARLGAWPVCPGCSWFGILWLVFYKKNFGGRVGFQNFIWAFKVLTRVAWLPCLGCYFLHVSRPPPSHSHLFSLDSEESCSPQSHPSQDCYIRNGNFWFAHFQWRPFNHCWCTPFILLS